jgi:NAD(P)-dependent dehydrogenase (short-subunit alcohol dehydrogenase family)
MSNQLASIVTGGGRGIGKAVALRLARQTAVLIVGRNEASLAAVCAEIRSAGGLADCVVGDVANPDVATKAVDKAAANGWTVQNLVVNAGWGKGGPSATLDKQVWRGMFAVNVHGAFWFIQACLPGMIERKQGSICIISSIAGVKGYKYQCAYTATKHALVGMARSLALEHAKNGIVVVPICPGFVDTDMTAQTIAGLVKHRGVSEADARQIVADKSPQKRVIPADEVAEAVAFVSSGKVPSLNGNPLILSGGE